MNLKKWRGIYE